MIAGGLWLGVIYCYENIIYCCWGPFVFVKELLEAVANCCFIPCEIMF